MYTYTHVSGVKSYLDPEFLGKSGGEHNTILRTNLLGDGDITGPNENKQTKAS